MQVTFARKGDYTGTMSNMFVVTNKITGISLANDSQVSLDGDSFHNKLRRSMTQYRKCEAVSNVLTLYCAIINDDET